MTINTVIILGLVLLAVATTTVTYLIIKQFLSRDEKMRLLDLKKSTQSISTPIRMQAYERLILFLERTHPKQLVLSHRASENIPAKDYANVLIKQIQSEFEHNVSQQIYVSDRIWEFIVGAKNQAIAEIRKSMIELPPNVSAMALVEKIKLTLEKDGEFAVIWLSEEAIRKLKHDFKNEF